MLRKILLASSALFLLMAGPANAAPIVTGIAGLLGAIGGGGLTLGSLAIGLVSMGAQWLLSKLLTPDQKQRGVKTRMETGGDKPPAFIVGEYATAGQLVYANVWDGGDIPQQCLVYVIALSCLPVSGLSNYIYVNNERCTIDTGSDWEGNFHEVTEYVQGGDDGGYLLVKFHDGTQNSADNWLLDKFGSDPDRPWQNDMIGEGTAYVIIQAWYSNRGVWTGLPEIRWIVQGIKLYDPREDTSVGGSGPQRWNDKSTWQHTKNPKVIEYNIIRGIRYGGEKLWGGDAEAYRLPLDYWFAAMNVCDENVTKANSDVINRYEIGGEIHLDDKPLEIINEINKSCAGYTTEFGGTYKTWCGGPGLAVGTITDDDFIITADLETNKIQGRQDTYNTVYATYPEPREQWEVKDGPRYQNAADLTEDGEELALDLALPLVTEGNQVQRLMRHFERDSRRQVTHAGQLPPAAWVWEPFDRLSYESDMFGYGGSGKDFIVASKEDLPNVNQMMLLREWNPDDEGWLTEYELPDSVGPLVVVKPGAMSLDFTVSPDQIDSASGKDKPAILIEWSWFGQDIDVENIKWELRRAGTTKVIAEGRIRNPTEGSRTIAPAVLRFGGHYEIRLKAEPYAVRDAVWTGWKSVTCVIVDVPTAPSLTRVSELGDDGKLDFFIDVDWTAVSQEATYVVRLVVGAKTLIYPSDTNSLRVPVISGKSYTVDVRAIGADGTRGDWSTTASITVTKKNTAPTTPAGLTANGGNRRVKLKWTKCPDADYEETVVYQSTTNDFTTATEVARMPGTTAVIDNLAVSTAYYHWITHFNHSDNESAKHPTSNTAGVSATTTQVQTADLAAGSVTDTTTDQTAPSVPTVSLAGYGDDFDRDGTVDAGLTITATNPNTGIRISRYVVEIWSSETSGGTYALWKRVSFEAEDYADSATTQYQVKASRKKFYKAKIRAIGYNSKKSAFSSLSAYAQPTASLSYTGQTASAPAVATIANGYVYSWSLGALDASVYKETEILVNGASLIKVSGTSYTDPTARTVGSTPTITVKHYDKSGGVTTVSTGTVAGAYRATVSAEIGTGQVTAGNTDPSALGAPTGLALALNYQNTDRDGTIDTTYKATWSALTGAVRYEIEISRSDTSGGTYTVIDNIIATALLASWKVVTGKYYKARIRAFSFNGTPGAWSSLVGPVNPAAKSTGPAAPTGVTSGLYPGIIEIRWDKPTEADYSYTQIADTSGFEPVIIAETTSTHIIIPIVAGSPVSDFRILHVNTSDVWGAEYNLTSSASVPYVDTSDIKTDAITTARMADGAATNAKIASNAISVWEKVNPAGGTTVTASTTADVITCTSNHTADATHVEVSGTFKNNSGGQRTIDIVFRAGSTDLFTISGYTMPDQAVWSGSYIDAGPSGASTDYKIRVTAGATSFTANNRYMDTKARKGK